jgi:Kef-type K+ transport system membrane component KefB
VVPLVAVRARAEREGEGDYARDETDASRLDRNYGEQLQELRVAQTGVQILFAFLLGIAFQSRFAQITTPERVLYCITLICAACSAILLISPAAAHRILFRRHLKDELVALTAMVAAIGLVFLGIAMLTGLALVLTVAVDETFGIVVSVALAAVLIGVWYLAPWREISKAHSHPHAATRDEVERRAVTDDHAADGERSARTARSAHMQRTR